MVDADASDRFQQLVARALTQCRVEVRQRLVEEKQTRFGSQSTCQRDALLLSTGDLPGTTSAESFEVHQTQHLGHPPLDLRLRPALTFETERDVLRHRHVGEECVVLEHHADAALGRRHAHQVVTVETDRSGIARLEPRQQTQRRRFARPRQPEKRKHLALLYVERQPLQNRYAILRGAEGLAQFAQLEEGLVLRRHRKGFGRRLGLDSV